MSWQVVTSAICAAAVAQIGGRVGPGNGVAGHLRKADPMVETWHFRGLVEIDLVERRLHDEETITAHEITIAAASDVDAFLRAYAL